MGVIHTEAAAAVLPVRQTASDHTVAAHTAAVVAAVLHNVAAVAVATAAAGHHQKQHSGRRFSGRRSWRAEEAGRGPRRRRPTAAGCSSRPRAA